MEKGESLSPLLTPVLLKSGRLTSAIASDETDIHTLRRVKGVDLVKTICGLGVKQP